VDNAPPSSSIDLELDRANTGEFRKERRLPGDRRQRVGFNPQGPDGSLLFETTVQDWTYELDTRGITGTRSLRAKLLGPPPQSRVLQTQTMKIVLDDSPPEDARIRSVGGLAIPAPDQRDKPIEILKASSFEIVAEALDKESGVAEVLVFLGRPVDGKPPQGVTPLRAQPINDARTRWKARLPLADRIGIVEITAEFKNAVGLCSFDTVALDVRNPKPPDQPGTDKHGKIVGKVTEGGRLQKGLEVSLKDDKGIDKAKTKTRDDGTFVFDDLPPGNYKISAVKEFSKSKDEKTVTVEAGKTTTADLALVR
jgi:hypothetical protein